MNTVDRRHCLICGTWWAIKDEDTPRECPTCQERGVDVLACPQPDCDGVRGHDEGVHELSRVTVRPRCTCHVRSDAIGPHTRRCPNHPEYGR